MSQVHPREEEERFVVDVAGRLIPIKSMSPQSGGTGESDRADEICAILKELGFDDFSRYDVNDSTGHPRSSVVLKRGSKERTLWIVAHIDTVPEGDLSLWTHDPFAVTMEGNRMYGRGTSDNGQAVLLSMLLLRSLREKELNYNLGIAFVADEETGSEYGIQHLISKGVFSRSDLILVPDAGNEKGDEIETAEKSILWLKFRISGKQYHASMPFNAINASREGMKFMLELDRVLHDEYKATSDIFLPPYSTFEPTKHEKNVDNINTIPGMEIQYLDCRILPQYGLNDVLARIDSVIDSFQKESKATVTYEAVQREQAPEPTPEGSEIVVKLKDSIKKVRGFEPGVIGIGGGTCAAYFRRDGIPAAVWSTTVPECAHKPDEYMLMDHLFMDRDVIEDILYS